MMRPSLMSRSYGMVSLLSSPSRAGLPGGLSAFRNAASLRPRGRPVNSAPSARMIVTQTRVRIPKGAQTLSRRAGPGNGHAESQRVDPLLAPIATRPIVVGHELRGQDLELERPGREPREFAGRPRDLRLRVAVWPEDPVKVIPGRREIVGPVEEG